MRYKQFSYFLYDLFIEIINQKRIDNLKLDDYFMDINMFFKYDICEYQFDFIESDPRYY